MPHEFAPPPAEAAPIALHLRLQSVEQKIDKLPDAIVSRLGGQFVPIDQCIHLSPSARPPDPPPPFWPTARQWFFAAITVGALIGGALGLIPAQPTTGQPQPPAVTAPR